MILHVFSVHNAEKEDIWAFFGVLGGQIFLVEKEYISSKRKTYGKPTLTDALIEKIYKLQGNFGKQLIVHVSLSNNLIDRSAVNVHMAK